MSQNEAAPAPFDFNRREFIKGASFSSLMVLMGGIPLQAEDKTSAVPDVDTGFSTIGAPVSCAVIGCGIWGREILQTLATLPNAPVPAICDTYEPFLRRAKEAAPKAEAVQDYRQVLERKDVQAVIVATPTHQHREIVLAALQAGKHVYCEAPIAATVDDARAIAQAAKDAGKLNFQSGLQARSDPQNHFLLVNHVRAASYGKPVMARSQWHKKQSWRRASPNPEREKAVNWRLNKEISTGLVGELGIHQLDLITWFLNQRPAGVSGFGGILNWNDGRDVADTVQSVFEYPGGVNYFYDCTLANSFDADYNMIYGTDAAIMMRGSKAWLFKEVDSPLLGWEIYASKDQFYKETGIVLAANATKSVKNEAKSAESAYADSPLHFALAAFIQNSRVTANGVRDFVAAYGADAEGLSDYLAGLSKARLPAAGYQEGFDATVTAIKANEAITKGQKIALQKEWFDV